MLDQAANKEIKRVAKAVGDLLEDFLSERQEKRAREEAARIEAERAAAARAKQPKPQPGPDYSRDRRGDMASRSLGWDSLAASYYHKEDGYYNVIEQGLIVGEVQPGWYLCEAFDWDGKDNGHQRLYHVKDMGEFRFYDTPEWMQDALENPPRVDKDTGLA
jgi:hypothetical protein